MKNQGKTFRLSCLREDAAPPVPVAFPIILRLLRYADGYIVKMRGLDFLYIESLVRRRGVGVKRGLIGII